MVIYAGFSLLLIADVLLSMFSASHLNAMGAVRDIGDVIVHFLPALLLLAYYAFFFLSVARSGRVNRTSVKVHSGVLLVLGLGIAIPFMGAILARLTPVNILYGFIVSSVPTDVGYPSILTLAAVFSLLNIWVLLVARRRG